MQRARWNERFLSSTRGRIVDFLRRASRTVEELAQMLGLTDNAVRAHLATLERDGLVQQEGVRRGAGKPAYAYALTSEAETLFPKAYGSVLGEVLDELGERLGSAGLDDIMRVVGHRIAAQNPAAGDLHSRLAAGVDVLNGLGGLAEVEERDGRVFLRGYSCPLAEATARHPQVCSMAEALLTEVVGEPVRECCTRDGSPRCCFEVLANGRS